MQAPPERVGLSICNDRQRHVVVIDDWLTPRLPCLRLRATKSSPNRRSTIAGATSSSSSPSERRAYARLSSPWSGKPFIRAAAFFCGLCAMLLVRDSRFASNVSSDTDLSKRDFATITRDKLDFRTHMRPLVALLLVLANSAMLAAQTVQKS